MADLISTPFLRQTFEEKLDIVKKQLRGLRAVSLAHRVRGKLLWRDCGNDGGVGGQVPLNEQPWKKTPKPAEGPQLV